MLTIKVLKSYYTLQEEQQNKKSDYSQDFNIDCLPAEQPDYSQDFNLPAEQTSPFDQFNVEIMLPGTYVGIDVGITLFTIQLSCIVLLIILLLTIGLKTSKLIATRLQIILETIYQFIFKLITDQAGIKGLSYFGFFLSVFLFILFMNYFGLLPFGFTITGHIVITFTLAITFFVALFMIAIAELKEKFIMIFLPSGLPLWLMPLIVVIEIFSFLIRPLSLGIRLFANMLAGHVLLYILASGLLVIASTALLLNILPMIIINFFVLLELFISLIQSYVFITLLSIYLVDSLYPKH